ncbi:MAG: cyclic nucleotide-gated ion channel [Minwuia sp.]|nr:cyclic nucleotide-gated ion channel [Minwuia sp.]
MVAQRDEVSLRHRTFEVVEEAGPGDRLSLLFDRFLIVLITLNIAAVVLETVPSLHDRFGPEFMVFEVVSVIIFTAEYFVRIWVAPEHPSLKRHGPVMSRVRYALSFGALIDLVAFLPFYLAIFFGADLRVLRVLRLLRFLKLMRYSSALMTLQRVFYDERRALLASLLIMFGLLIISSTAIYHAERHAQPEAFGSIPAAMWWSLATLTTVGYGDIVPVTLYGKMIGGVVMLFGLGMFALPLGIIAMGFSQEVNQRQFVVTPAMVAKVPLFEDLNAREIVRISRMMRARRYASDETIIQGGSEPWEELLFVANGIVTVEFATGSHTVIEGGIFGAESVLRLGHQILSAVAETPVQLMMLEANDARDLIRRHPEIGDTLRAQVASAEAAEAAASADT